jgi:PAS domain S-box-containing protein
MTQIADSSADFGRLSATIDRAPVGIAHFDHSGRFIFVNPQLCTIFGLTHEEVLRKTFQEVSSPEDLPRCMSLTQQLGVGLIPKYTTEKRFMRPDGSFVYSRVIVTAVRDESGLIQFFLGIVEDLSEQWEIEQQRRAAEDRLRLALEASGAGIFRYDFRTEALDYSNNLNRVFGFPPDEPLQDLDRLLSAIHPDDLPGVLELYQRSATEGADFDHEFRVVWPDGTVRWVSDRAKMTLGDDGQAHYLTGACIDITARREAESQREALLAAERKARADAERATRMRDEVLAVVAHDLRNPVHTIVVSTAVLGALPESNHADRRKQVDVIQRNARSMDHLIRDLLDVAQIQMGQLAIQVAPVAVDAVVHEVVAGCLPQAAQRGLVLEADVAAGLPPMLADRGRISQVLNNLVGNALKFTTAGRIVVSAGRNGDRIELAVSDTGCGIAASHLPKVFDRYWQSQRGGSHGVGLGLAIVRGIVEAHGGSVAVDSVLGEGTTFRCTVPVAEAL